MRPGVEQNQKHPHRAIVRRSRFSTKRIEFSTSPSGSSSSARRISSDSRLAIQRLPSPLPLQDEILTRLENMSVDKLRMLLADRDEYNKFALSLREVQIQTNIYGELKKDVLKLARENLANDSRITEHKSECEDLISTEIKEYELKLGELEKQMEEITDTSSTRALLLKLQDAMEKAEEESECLKGKLLAEEMELSEFLQSYKAKRVLYRKRELLLGATKTFAS